MSDIYELQNSKRKKNADKILYEYGLWNFLSKIGKLSDGSDGVE